MAYYDPAYKRVQRRFRDKPIKPWRAVVWIDSRRVHLGRYVTYEEALQVELVEKRRYMAEWEEDHGAPYPGFIRKRTHA